MLDLQEQILDAVNVLVQRGVSKAPFDTSMMCTIESLDNPEISEYTVSHKNNKFKAYATNGEEFYAGDQVLVMTPQNQIGKKYIIGGPSKAIASRNGVFWKHYSE